MCAFRFVVWLLWLLFSFSFLFLFLFLFSSPSDHALRLTKEYYSTYFILVALFVVAGAISRPFSKALATVHRQQVLVPCSHLVPLIRQIYDRLASHDRHEDRTTTAWIPTTKRTKLKLPARTAAVTVVRWVIVAPTKTPKPIRHDNKKSGLQEKSAAGPQGRRHPPLVRKRMTRLRRAMSWTTWRQAVRYRSVR